MSSYSKIFNFNFKILTIIGLWNIKTTNKSKLRLYYFYQCFSILFLTLFNVLSYIDLYLVRHDFEKFNFNLCSAVTTTMTLLKTLRALEKLPEINLLNKNLIRDSKDEKDVEVKRIIERTTWEMNFLNKFYYTMCYSFMGIWSLTPLMDSEPGMRKLPFRQWFPFDSQVTPNYEMVYVYQVISCYFICSNIVSSDVATYGFMIRISAEYDILKRKLEKLSEVYENEDEGVRDEEAWKIIKNCVVHHQEILLRSRELEEVYNSILLIQFLAVTLLLAIVGVDVTVMSSQFNMRFVTQLVYLGVALLDLFFFCFYGTRLQHKSYNIVDSAFSAPWYLMKTRFRGYLSLIIAKAQQPPIVTGGKMLTINFIAFLKVLKTTYNMLALFSQIVSKDKKIVS